MTGITIYNVQREGAPKAGNSDLWFLCSAHQILVIHLHKVSKNISKQFSSYRADTYITEITIFNVQRCHSFKSRFSSYGYSVLHPVS